MSIRALDDAVVQQIAAGEIIVSPRNALKELLENSIDSGASKIEVIVADGGFKLLHVTDNGSGISASDLPILCQRHTTSKITEFSDLEQCKTLGFRGEALASISFVANLKVVTKTKDANTATRAEYDEGVLKSQKLAAGLDGTQIIVENLFYTNPSRKQALRGSVKTEYGAILDIVSKYAIEYPGTYTCKQQGDAQPTVINDGSRQDKIRSIYGSSVAQHLLELDCTDEQTGLHATGYVSDLNYTSSKSIPYVFFVNGRLVEFKALQRAIQLVYAGHLPKTQQFVFLSIRVTPEDVDINTHPTKSQVTLLHESEIVTVICATLEELLSKDDSRTYSTQTLLTSTQTQIHVPAVATAPSSQRYEHKLVRTDPKQTTLVFSRPTVKTSQPTQLSPRKNKRVEELEDPCERPRSESSDTNIDTTEYSQRPVNPINLASIQILKQTVQDEVSEVLTGILSQHTFIGIVDYDRSLAAIQYDVRLFLADYGALSYQLFYQTALLDFANFGTIHLGDGLNVQQLVDLHPEGGDIVPKFWDMSPMLEEYFQIKLVNKGGVMVVTQMPLLLSGYTPSVARLPGFFVDLNKISDWSDELACLEKITRALASWCVPVRPHIEELRLIFDALKTRFVATKPLSETLVEIASLPGLYKVFERC